MEATPPADLTPLQQRVAREIVSLVRRGGYQLGDHLREVPISEAIGISRSPVKVALHHLATLGAISKDANRGYFMAKDARDWADLASLFSESPDDPLYLRIADDRQSGTLEADVSEAELMRRYDVARSTLRKVLSRISEEGWVEQRVGHGWTFLPMIDSPQAYEESYLFRQTMEPSGLLGPSFSFDKLELAEVRREQQRIVDGGFRSMTAIELFEANNRFHETLASWSHNRFIHQSVRRINQLRRLVEYRQYSSHRPIRHTQAAEHLQILAAVESHDLVTAASLLRAHLDGARRSKSHTEKLFS